MTHRITATTEAHGALVTGDRATTRTLWLGLGVLALLLTGCGNYGGNPDSGSGAGGTILVGGGVLGAASTSEQVTAFQATVYPLLTANCQGCHAGSGPGSPHIAHPDATTAFYAVVDQQKVNMNTTETSRLVRRLVADGHYCWSNCVADGTAMLAAIDAWAAMSDFSNPNAVSVDAIQSSTLTLDDGIEDEGEERHEANLIAFYEFKEVAGTVARDTSNVPGYEPMDLELDENAEWMPSYGLTFQDGVASATRESSVKLYDLIASPEKGTGQYSVEAWVIPGNTTQEGPARIVSYSSGTGSRNFTLGQHLYNYDFRARSMAAEITDNGRPSLQTYDADRDLQETLQHVVMTFDLYRGRRIYVNGQFTDDVDEFGGGRLWNWSPNHQLLLGNERGNSRPWLGKIQLVAVYNSALTEDEIQQNFRAGVGRRLLMTFDVSSFAGPGTSIRFVVSELDEYSYLFCEPTFIGPNPNGLRLSALRVALNGEIPAAGQAFTNVDVALNRTEQLLSPQCSVIFNDPDGPDDDLFTIVFESLGNFATVPEPEDDPRVLTTFVASSTPLPELGIRSFARVNETMAELTGVRDPALAASPLDTFRELEQQLPSSTNLQSFVSSQQVGVSKLALDYCDVMLEDPGLRSAFFDTFPPFDFNAPIQTAFLTDRDLLIDKLYEKMISQDLADQPDPADVAIVLDGLVDDLIATCSAGSCGTLDVVKGLCTSVLSSAAVQVH